MKDDLHFVEVSPDNVMQETLFCVKDLKSPGFDRKKSWFEKRYEEGLRIKILKRNKAPWPLSNTCPRSRPGGPLEAPGFMFIHCMYVHSRKERSQGLGSALVQHAEQDARKQKMAGLCVMSSKGPWIADRTLFEKNGFAEVDRRGRFELLSKKWKKSAGDPQLIDWTENQKEYQGWHLVYADQCPWHEKAVEALRTTAAEHDIALQIWKLESAKEARQAPSGFGVFSLLHDGKLLEDHYISKTRFLNILKKELGGS